MLGEMTFFFVFSTLDTFVGIMIQYHSCTNINYTKMINIDAPPEIEKSFLKM